MKTINQIHPSIINLFYRLVVHLLLNSRKKTKIGLIKVTVVITEVALY